MAQRVGGQYDQAIASFEIALKLVPLRPVNYISNLAWAYMGNRQFHEAVGLFTEVIDRSSPKSFYSFYAYLGLAGAYELTGDHERAGWAANNVMQINPKFSLTRLYINSTFKDGAVKETIYNAYRKARLE